MTPLTQVAIVVVFVATYAWYHFAVVVPRRKEHQRFEKVLEVYNTELNRIDALPKISTEFLLAVPMSFGQPDKKLARSYGTRYNRVLLFDENGQGWVGLVTPEILYGLRDGEYTWEDYIIPFQGPGERYGAQPVDMNELHIDIYPLWMRKNVDPISWKQWAKIERNFARIYSGTGRDYQKDMGETFTREYRNDVERKRAQFCKLAIAAKMV